MLKLAIYSHDPLTIASATEYAARYATEKGVECNAKSYETIEDLIKGQNEYDAVFVCLEDDGVVSCAKLRENKYHKPIVFVGQANHFSLEGKTIDAMGLLVTPFSYYAFATTLDRIQTRLVSMETPSVALMTKKGARRVAVDEITYIENSGLHTVCHLVDGDIHINGSLSDAEKKLTADRFFRLGKYLLNLGHVYKVSGYDVYVGTACLPLPLNKKAELLSSLLAFMNRG